MVSVLNDAGVEPQLALIRAHPELAGKAMVSNTLTAESTNEQSKAGLTNCTPEEFAHIQQLNADYNARFGFPFILAVRGPRGTGLAKAEIIATFERRLHNPVDFERAECLRHIHRIAEIRLNDKFGFEPTLGNEVWDWQEALAQHTDPGYAELGQLTVTYLTEAHRACAAQLQQQMLDCGFDEVHIDAVGNVVGRYLGARPMQEHCSPAATTTPYATAASTTAAWASTCPWPACRELHQAQQRLPFAIEVVGFSEEEGQRYKATFLGSGALTGHFNPAWLEQKDADGITMREAMQHAGLPATLEAIAALQRDPAQVPGLCRGAHRAGPGAQRAGHAARRGHLHQRQRALPGRRDRHGLPRRHHAHGPAARCRLRRGRAGALRRTARRCKTAIRWPPSAC